MTDATNGEALNAVRDSLLRFIETTDDDGTTDLDRDILSGLVAFGYLMKRRAGRLGWLYELTPAGRHVAESRQPTASAGMVVDRLKAAASALNSTLGDTDPYVSDDMTDEDIRDENPVWWATSELNGVLSEILAAHESQSPNADTTPDVSERGQECEADKLLIALGLDPARFRTEGGLLNAGKIKAALIHPEDYSGLYLGRDCCKRCGSPKSKRMRSSAGNMDVCDDCGVPRFASSNKPTDNVEGE